MVNIKPITKDFEKEILLSEAKEKIDEQSDLKNTEYANISKQESQTLNPLELGGVYSMPIQEAANILKNNKEKYQEKRRVRIDTVAINSFALVGFIISIIIIIDEIFSNDLAYQKSLEIFVYTILAVLFVSIIKRYDISRKVLILGGYGIAVLGVVNILLKSSSYILNVVSIVLAISLILFFGSKRIKRYFQ
ncbi:MAG TPA: hypothetical protein PLO25_02380 [Candidatus Saccharibacteria bacterium]|nr:hypothetical protein [Candidatus Saccharibacteria bacterium]